MTIKDQYIFALGDNKEDALHVQQGELLEFITKDCFNNQITCEDYVLDKMLKIKSLFSNDKIEIRDYNKLNRVIKELDLNVSQINKLNELFSTP